MKTVLKILLLSGLIGIIAFSCRKDTIIKPQYNANITLYNKPLDVIRANILGKWKLEYEKGGICSTCINDHFKNYIWEFTSDNKIIQTYNDTLLADSKISWLKGKDVYGRLTYLMNFYQGIVPIDLIVNYIHDDTLVFSDNAADAVSYYLLRLN